MSFTYLVQSGEGERIRIGEVVQSQFKSERRKREEKRKRKIKKESIVFPDSERSLILR